MTIQNLTSQEMLTLVVGVIIVVLIIGMFFKTMLKLAIVAAVCIMVFGVGFGWLPQKMEEIRNGTTTPGEVINEILPTNEVLNQAENTYNQVHNTITDPVLQQNIIDTISSLWTKLIQMFSGTADNTVNNVIDNTTVNTIDNTTNTVNNTTP